MRTTARRARCITGKERQTVALLQALAQQIEDGRARANLRIELEPTREVWLVAASVPRTGER